MLYVYISFYLIELRPTSSANVKHFPIRAGENGEL